MSSNPVGSTPSTPDWVTQFLDSVLNEAGLTGEKPPVSNLAIVSGLMREPLEEFKKEQKFWRQPDRRLVGYLFFIVVTRFLKDHKVGFVKRQLIALALNEMLCAAMHPAEYRSYYAAQRNLVERLREALG